MKGIWIVRDLKSPSSRYIRGCILSTTKRLASRAISQVLRNSDDLPKRVTLPARLKWIRRKTPYVIQYVTLLACTDRKGTRSSQGEKTRRSDDQGTFRQRSS